VLCTAVTTTILGAPWPFTVENPHGQWTALSVQKQPVPGLTIETVIAHADGQTRIFILSAPKTDDAPGSLMAFAGLVKGCFPAYQSTALAEKDAEEIGFSGRDLRFELAREKEILSCELFVFAQDKNWWGVLRVAPRGAPAPSQPPFAIFHAKLNLPAGVVGMEPVHVKDTPLTSFPISLEIVPDYATDRIVRILVNEVPEGSITERAGVKVGDEIIAINGRKITDFKVGVGKDSEIGRIFLNREPGDMVDLELMAHTPGRKSRTVTLRVSSQAGFFHGP
jgi:PDZ domain